MLDQKRDSLSASNQEVDQILNKKLSDGDESVPSRLFESEKKRQGAQYNSVGMSPAKDAKRPPLFKIKTFHKVPMGVKHTSVEIEQEYVESE